jgi:hypothetical protein
MPHKKSGWVKDVFGELFEVAEFRGTTHGFDLLFGWPERRKKGLGRGRCEVILTMPLAEHLNRFRMRPWELDLPIAAS